MQIVKLVLMQLCHSCVEMGPRLSDRTSAQAIPEAADRVGAVPNGGYGYLRTSGQREPPYSSVPGTQLRVFLLLATPGISCEIRGGESEMEQGFLTVCPVFCSQNRASSFLSDCLPSCPEDGGSTFFRNVSNDLSSYTQNMIAHSAE
jgi:hypothetical protein